MSRKKNERPNFVRLWEEFRHSIGPEIESELNCVRMRNALAQRYERESPENRQVSTKAPKPPLDENAEPE